MLFNKRRTIKIAKGTFKLLATIGTAIIVKSIFDVVTPKDTSPAKKVAVVIGGYVLSDMIVEKVQNEAEKSWDRAVQSLEDIRGLFRG